MGATEDFADLKFKVDCGSMQFVSAAGVIIACGPGEIRQDEGGALHYKSFVGEDAYLNLLGETMRGREIGSIIPEDHFLTLHAQDLNGKVWVATHVLPHSAAGVNSTLVSGKLHDLADTQELTTRFTKAHVSVRFKGLIDFPVTHGTEVTTKRGTRNPSTSWAADHAQISDDQFTFEAHHEHGHTILLLSLPADELTPATPLRMIEAFQFMLGREVSPMVIETHHENTVTTRLRSPIEGDGSILPPLKFSTFDEDGNVWKIFTKYFRHIHADDTPRQWHLLSRHIGSVIESSKASLNVRVLALAVAVEGIAAHCFPDLAPPSEAFLADLEKMEALLASGAYGEECVKRIGGAVSNMKKARGSDILRAFLATRNLPHALYKSWSDLRHPAAHGGGMDAGDIAINIQRMHHTTALLYTLLLEAIGYTGARTDYSAANWPRSQWPPEKSVEIEAVGSEAVVSSSAFPG